MFEEKGEPKRGSNVRPSAYQPYHQAKQAHEQRQPYGGDKKDSQVEGIMIVAT